MVNQQRPLTIYAVVDLDCWSNAEEEDGTGQLHDENKIVFALIYKLRSKIDKIIKKNSQKNRKWKIVNVTVVGATDKNGADHISIRLERLLPLLNVFFELNKTSMVRFKGFVLLDKNRHGKVLRPRTEYLASDSPPSDVSGHIVFLTSRPYIRELLKDRRSWWGDTVGCLTSVSKLKWTGIR